jgi:hypothetical protein
LRRNVAFCHLVLGVVAILVGVASCGADRPPSAVSPAAPSPNDPAPSDRAAPEGSATLAATAPTKPPPDPLAGAKHEAELEGFFANDGADPQHAAREAALQKKLSGVGSGRLSGVSVKSITCKATMCRIELGYTSQADERAAGLFGPSGVLTDGATYGSYVSSEPTKLRGILFRWHVGGPPNLGTPPTKPPVDPAVYAKREAELEGWFANDAPDPQHATREADLQQRLSKRRLAGVTVVSVTCKATMCRLEFNYATANDGHSANGLLMGPAGILTEGSTYGGYVTSQPDRLRGLFFRWHVGGPPNLGQAPTKP